MAFGHAGGADTHESGVFPQGFHILSSAISHARPQAADQLIDEVTKRATIWDAAFHAFGDKLAGAFDISLSVAVFAAVHHRPHATHAAVGFVAPALVNDKLARRFV